jgi:hypothetical protein
MRCISISCVLPLLGGRGVLDFSELTQCFKLQLVANFPPQRDRGSCIVRSGFIIDYFRLSMTFFMVIPISAGEST